MIDPSFWTDEKLGLLTPMHRLLFMGLISNADDEGRLQGHPALVKSMVFPYDVDITHQQVEKWLIDLHNEGLIWIYEVGKQRYIWIRNFLKYQQINRPTPSKLPAPPEDADDIKLISTESETSETAHEQLSEDSLNTHEQLNESSLNTHSEKNRKEKEIEIEREENINDLTFLTESACQQDKPVDTSKQSPPPYKKIAELYNTICVSLPKVEELTDKRKRHIKVTWVNFKQDISKFRELFERAEASDFLSGRSGRWRCNFDWLIVYNNAVKVLEGVYDNKPNSQNTGQTIKGVKYDDEYAEFYE